MSAKRLIWVREMLEKSNLLEGSNLFGRDDDEWSGGAIDTRSECKGMLFFTLKGEQTDGHNFAKKAMKHGAVAAVLEREDVAGELALDAMPYFLVKNALESLQELARRYRDTLGARVAAITGSSGKTTTKEFIKGGLSKQFLVQCNPGNFNNHIGVPLTILGTGPDCEFLVSEVGANHSGEIDFLCSILRPEFGVITNIGDAHIGLFGSRERVAEAKAELLDNLPESGCAVLPGDDVFLDLLKRHCQSRFVTFGSRETCEFHITNVEQEKDQITFSVFGETVVLKMSGRHNAMNAAAAIALCVQAGIDPKLAARAMGEMEPLQGRGRFLEAGKVMIIDDAYNANPTSVKASIDNLLSMQAKRKIAVLGDMKELGEYTESSHRELGEYLAGTLMDIIFWVGESGKFVAEGLKRGGRGNAFYGHDDLESLIQAVKKEIQPGDAVLLKGSRVCRLDEAVSRLLVYLKRKKES